MGELQAKSGEPMEPETAGEAALRVIAEDLAAMQRGMTQDEAELGPIRNSMLRRAMDIGDLLNQAKRLLPHGEFCNWRNKHFLGGKMQASKYMKLAANRVLIESKVQSAGLLGIEGADQIVREQRRLPDPETQCGKLLARLQQGPATPDELSKIAPKYTSRISDLRTKHGVNVKSDGGEVRIEPGKPPKKSKSKQERIVEAFATLPTATKHATARKINADPEVASLRVSKAAKESRNNLPAVEYVDQELGQARVIAQKILTSYANGKKRVWINGAEPSQVSDYLAACRQVRSNFDKLIEFFEREVENVSARQTD